MENNSLGGLHPFQKPLQFRTPDYLSQKPFNMNMQIRQHTVTIDSPVINSDKRVLELAPIFELKVKPVKTKSTGRDFNRLKLRNDIQQISHFN
jgi:hypothetical protein